MPSRITPLIRLTTAAKLAAIRPSAPIEVTDPNLLTSERLVIRPLIPADRDELLRVISISREHLSRHMPLHKEDESDVALFERLLDLSRRGLEQGRAWRAGYFDSRGGKMLGLVNLNDITRGLEGRAEANWWTAADALGQGYATEAVRAVLAHAFGDLPRGLGLQRVTALIAPENAASKRVAAKVGMRRSGSARSVAAANKPTELLINGKPTVHDAYDAFATLTAPCRMVSRRAGLRAGLVRILETEAAAAQVYA